MATRKTNVDIVTEQVILEATRNDDDRLQEMLQAAIEQMPEEQAIRLLDKVLQILREDARDARGWR